MVAFVEAYKHLTHKVYPCVRQKVAKYFYIALIIFVITFEFLGYIFDFHLPFTYWTCIVFFIALALYMLLYYKVCKCYGITIIGTVNFDVYADYIVTNYWKNIQYDINHNLLKNMLNDANNDKKANILPEILAKIITTAQNEYQRKYLIDCILYICNNENILSYMEKYLIPIAKDSGNVIHFLIIRMHAWNLSHRTPKNLLLYLLLLREFCERSDCEKSIIFDLVNFMNDDNEYQQKLSDLQNDGKCEFLETRHIHRIKEYRKAECEIKKAITEDYKRSGKSLSFEYSPSREDMS